MQQIAFSFNQNISNHPDEYIESQSNSLACRAIQNWNSHWGVEPYPKALIIQGPKSCGKTHLAEIWVKSSGALFIKKEHILTESILSYHAGFIIEDMDQGWNEEALLHHFNAINENKKYLLMTQASNIKPTLPDLASRIRATNKIKIDMPDDQLMQLLIFKIFSSHSVVVKPGVIDYMLKVLPREFNKITDYTKKINDYALISKRKITIPLVKEIISSL